MMQRSFTMEYWQDAGWFVGRLREVPGVFSQGETLEELEENIRDAYELVLADMTATTTPVGISPSSSRSRCEAARLPRGAEEGGL